MANKVTLRVEQYDNNNDGNISIQGPINVFKTVEAIEDLYLLPSQPGFPQVIDNEDNTADTTPQPDVIAFVKNITGYGNSIQYRGAYFKYNYVTGSWQEILVGTHSHDNKDILDKITAGDIGSWANITNYPSVNFGIEEPSKKFAGLIFVNIATNKMYRYYKQQNTNTILSAEITNASFDNKFPLDPSIRDLFFNTDTEKLYIFGGAKAGERRMLVMEVTDPDNSDMTYSYDVAWTDLPASIPEAPDLDPELNYLGLDSGGNPVWKNTIVPRQVFDYRQITIVGVNPNTDLYEWEIGNTNTITIPNVSYNQATDRALVMDNKVFLINPTITYNPSLKVLTIVNTEGDFEVGEIITVLIIRDGAAAVLDELARDYVTKDEAINLLSGGTIRLKNYATKTDLQGRAARDHTHSQFARIEHDHDYRYANYKHTHEEYLTRGKVLELIQEQVQMNPGILNILQDFSNYLNSISETPELEELISSLASQADITEINNKIVNIENTYYNIEQLESRLSERQFRSDQILTNFVNESSQDPKNLEQVLDEFRVKIEEDLATIETDDVFLNESITVKVGENNFIGGIPDGEEIIEGTPIQLILEKLLRRRIPYVYRPAELITTFNVNSFPEVGSTIPLSITSQYEIKDSGLLKRYIITISSNGTITNLLNVNSLQAFNGNITVGANPVTINVYAEYNAGSLKSNNLGEQQPFSEISDGLPAGITAVVSKTLTPVRAIFYGGTVATTNNINSDFIRNNFIIDTNDSYNVIDVEVSIPIGTNIILFALPILPGEKDELDEIEYREQFFQNIKGSFNLEQINISGDGNSAPILYNVYYFRLPFPSSSVMNMRFIKK
jgi:hypothetical protein